MKTLISGFNGWMGKSLIREIKQGNLPLEVKEIVGLTSRPNDVKNNFEGSIEDFNRFKPESEIEGFVHLAFLTREKVSQLPLADYEATNRKIINRAVEIIKVSKPKWVAIVSSGAVFSKKSGFSILESEFETNPYGYLKLEEERAITQIAREIGANLAIGRLWGASGPDLPPSSKYAISDFITSALQTGNISIKSDNPVFRKYCDASEFMNVLISAAMTKEYQLFNSGGETVELGELADEIASQIGNCTIARNYQPHLFTDDYYPKDNTYESLAKSQGKSILSLKNQVSRTISGHMEAEKHTES